MSGDVAIHQERQFDNLPDTIAALHLAVWKRQAAIIELLLDAKLDVNAVNAFGGTALHIAAAYCRADCVAMLLTFGADPNAKDNLAQTPLHRAVEPLYRAVRVDDAVKTVINELFDVTSLFRAI